MCYELVLKSIDCFDVLSTTINLILALECKLNPLPNGGETFSINLMLSSIFLKKNMQQKVMKVIKPFLRF